MFYFQTIADLISQDFPNTVKIIWNIAKTPHTHVWKCLMRKIVKQDAYANVNMF